MNATTLAEKPTGRFWAAMSVVCACLASIAGIFLLAGSWAFAIPFLATVVGILRRVQWGRRAALVLGWLSLIMGALWMTPLERGDEPHQELVPVEVVVMQAAIVCSMALVCIHLLGVYKKAFRPGWF